MRDGHSAADHGHRHHYLPASHARNERRTLIVVVLTAVTMVGEIAVGWLSGSMALLADGFHMATHAGAMGISVAAYAYARTRAGDPRFTFGTGKVGDLAGFTSAILLGVVALGIVAESVARLVTPGPIAFDQAMLVAVLGLLVNLVSAWLLRDDHGHGHGHGHHHDHAHGHAHAVPAAGGHGEDRNIRSAYLHVLADALTSVLAILALLGARQFGWLWLDPAVGIVGAIVIGRWAWGLLGDCARVLVDASETDRIADVANRIAAPGDVTVTDLHVWQVGPGAHAAIVALVAADPQPPATYRARLAPLSWLSHVTIEVSHCAQAHDPADPDACA
ncbi:CDF family Co(II)/Ni(II) efflux transporter DmeF [Sphingomonas flavalba]|uniref:CDF family Co(II)/Ni(II) efflux transporter DmeF n=1 Tax=Sphingomonas flavalba TaxID=2559804 RepID=UPI0039DFD0BC